MGVLTAEKWVRHDREFNDDKVANELKFMKSQVFDSSKKLETANSMKDLDHLIDQKSQGRSDLRKPIEPA